MEEKINQKYIPEDLDDCFKELEKLLVNEDYFAIKNGTEDIVYSFHHSLGRWLRNNWGLWQESRLSKWFNEKGIHHPDDMSGIILTSFWRSINSKPIQLEEQIKHYQDYWTKLDEEE